MSFHGLVIQFIFSFNNITLPSFITLFIHLATEDDLSEINI